MFRAATSTGRTAFLLVVLALAPGCGDNIPGAASDAGLGDGPSVDAPDSSNLPDLTMNIGRLEVDLAIGERDFTAESCELDPDEMCVGDVGTRRLLHFSVETPNLGDADMVLGQPNIGNDNFEYSECHAHFHFNGYAAYELLNAGGDTIAVGRKQAFCLLDTSVYDTSDPSVSQSPRYSCSFQGIQRGWADLYHSRLDCQFLDITVVPDGDYMLRIELNRDRLLEESNYDNNIALVPVTVGAVSLSTPTEACGDGLAPRDLESENRECGWRSDGVVNCTAGATVSIGCSQHCGAFSLGDCTGDPMLRVCDANRADGNCSYPAAVGFNDNICGERCPAAFDFECPASGAVEVFTSARTPEATYTCNLDVFEG